MTNEIIQLQPFERRSLPTLRDLTAVLFRQRRIMLAVFGVVVLLVLVSGVWRPSYESQMKILVVRQRMDAAVTSQANAPTQVSPVIREEDLNSEVEILRSEDLLRTVVAWTGLAHNTRFAFGHPNEEIAIASAVRELGKNLEIEPIRKTNVIAVKYRSRNPRMAAEVLNAIQSAYIEKHREIHRSSGEFTFFDQETERFRHELAKSQERLAAFTQKYGVVSAQLERDLTLQRLADFNANTHLAQASAAEIRQRLQSLRRQLDNMQPRITTEIKSSENQQLMQQLKSTLLNLELKRTELLTKFDPSYRLVQEVDKQISDTRLAVSAEEEKPPREETTDQDPTYTLLRGELAKAEAELSGLNARAAATRTAASDYREAARNLQEQGLEQEDLQRAAKIQEDDYLLYSRKREEARISDALDQRGILNVAIAQEPVVPALPVRSPIKTAGIALLLGIFLSVGTGFAVDYTDPSFRTPDEVVGFLEIPVLASLPKDS